MKRARPFLAPAPLTLASSTVLAILLSPLPGGAAPPAAVSAAQVVPPDVTIAVPFTVVATDAEAAARMFVGQPSDLVLTQARQSLAGEHVRFAVRASDGTLVAGGEVSVHMTRTGKDWTGRIVRTNVARPVVVQGSRRLGVKGAAAAAVAAVGGGTPVGLTEVALPSGAGIARAGWRMIVVQDDPRHEWEVWVDGETGAAQVARDGVFTVDGSGYVYRPNPVTTSGDTTLVDGGDADTPTLTALREMVAIQGLDGSGMLRGDYADVERPTARVNNPSLVYNYTRAPNEFEEVMAYYAVDHAQRHLQSLGFTGASAVMDFPLHVVADAFAADNSYYTSAGGPEIQLGRGGVDDAEDADVTTHEYGHAVQDDVIPGWGTSYDAGAMGEGFGDILAASTPTGSTVMVTRACIAPWDATSYSSTTPPCLRRMDGVKHYPEHMDGEVHDDGEIFSGAVWDMYSTTGLGPATGLGIVVEAHFSLGTGATFTQMANEIIAADTAVYGGAHVTQIRRTLTWHGMLRDLSPPDPFIGTVMSMPILVDSAHPITNLEDEVQTVSVPGASALRLHFSSLNMELDPACLDGICDAVYLYDANGLLYARLSGTSAPFNSVAIPGDTVTVRWVTDGTVTSTGFTIDSVSWVVGPSMLPDASPPDAPPPDASPPPLPDAAVALPDAAVALPDAAVALPDAAPGTADAAPGTADAAPGAPDASSESDSGSGVPDAGVDNKGGDASGCDCRTGGPTRGHSPARNALILFAFLGIARTLRRRRRGAHVFLRRR